jgi:hypothetical protein
VVEVPEQIGNYSFGIGRVVGSRVGGVMMSFEDRKRGCDRVEWVGLKYSIHNTDVCNS